LAIHPKIYGGYIAAWKVRAARNTHPDRALFQVCNDLVG
jgi:hypothetical protein